MSTTPETSEKRLCACGCGAEIDAFGSLPCEPRRYLNDRHRARAQRRRERSTPEGLARSRAREKKRMALRACRLSAPVVAEPRPVARPSIEEVRARLRLAADGRRRGVAHG